MHKNVSELTAKLILSNFCNRLEIGTTIIHILQSLSHFYFMLGQGR